METLKSLLKMISGLIGGCIIGLILAAIGLTCFTDTTFGEFLDKLCSAKFGESMIAAGIGVIMFIVSAFILVPLHELGHLVCGLLSGYKFVSFRIFNLTFIKLEGEIKIKRYAIAGTGGQCLLTPPDKPVEEIPTAWYNIGGVLANVIAVIVVSPLLLIKGHPFLTESVVIFMLTGVFLILINGIPMKISGTGNDAFNMIALRKNLIAKRGLVDALRSNALIQNGMRPKDMPDEWFIVPENIDYGNQLEVSIPLMAASRLIDEMKFNEALDRFEVLYDHKKDLIGLYVKEIECELVFLRLICGNVEGARELFSPELKKYIETYSKMMSSKERILCAVSLIMENNPEKAISIYNSLLNRENDYLLQGEVKSDLSVMKYMLANE